MRRACGLATSLMQTHRISSAITGRGIMAGESLNLVTLRERHSFSDDRQHACHPFVLRHQVPMWFRDAGDRRCDCNEYVSSAVQSCEHDHSNDHKLGKLDRRDVQHARHEQPIRDTGKPLTLFPPTHELCCWVRKSRVLPHLPNGGWHVQM